MSGVPSDPSPESDPDEVLEEVLRVAKPGGLLDDGDFLRRPLERQRGTGALPMR